MKLISGKPVRYQDINWRQCQTELLDLQQQLVKAYRANEVRRVRDLQRTIVTCFATRALAVRRVTTNQGGHTPGVDGVKWTSPRTRGEAIEALRELTQNPGHYRASPVRRVHIPKPGKAELRPLGIPTLTDRAMQAVYLSSIDPLAEESGDPNSYGFRPYRGSREAVAKLRNLLGRDYSPTWVLDADIARCFDQINHRWLLNHVPIGDVCVLESWLRSGVACASGFTETTLGVPQGGVISPALCNIALNGLEMAAQNAVAGLVPKRQRNKVHLIRYADDFVATAASEALLLKVTDGLAEFLEPRGLRLHPQKTRSLQLDASSASSFDFLGFEFSKRGLDPRINLPSAKGRSRTRLIVRPSKTNVRALMARVRRTIVPGAPMTRIIRELNPVLRGWANYFRVARHSPRTFSKLGYWIWHRMLRWGQAKHSRRNIAWIRARYVRVSRWRSNHWCAPTPRGAMYLLDVSTVTYQFVPAMASGLNPYDAQDRASLEARSATLAKTAASGIRRALLARDGGICPVCHTSVTTDSEPVELHHLTARASGGDWRLSNLVLLHSTCHKQVTADPDVDSALRAQYDSEPADRGMTRNPRRLA